MRFDELKFDDSVLEGIDAMGFETMTPVQEQAMPFIMDGRDMIACAQTGTGKTAAFMLPVLNALHKSHSDTKVKALVLVPTRELAIQIDQQIQGFAYFLNVSALAIYGGNDSMNWDVQRKAITSGVDVIVATPGRLIQHLNLKYVDLTGVEHFILDEADRMLDMGFYDDIVKIHKYMPQKKQTLMFSATMPKKIRDLAKTILYNPHEINIAISKPAEKIMQVAYMLYPNQKIPLVRHLLTNKEMTSVLIFSSTKSAVKEMAMDLKRQKLNAQAIHSDLEQKEREAILREFRNRKVQILVATDILARGIDIENIDLVMNFDVPSDPEDYVHRIGRTARAEKEGLAITFITEKDQDKFARIEQLIEREIYKAPVPPEFGDTPEYNPRKRSGGGNRNYRKKFNKPGNKGKKHFHKKDNKPTHPNAHHGDKKHQGKHHKPDQGKKD
ncbi:DEAD/DEAH box helicase [Saccharicrinis sp. FJH2]|uniref:DEAD/DEAH box helicase n=1 Tax=unclassified Saccharicrinis TaxID=2646859 RepID=UPI0035D4E769